MHQLQNGLCCQLLSLALVLAPNLKQKRLSTSSDRDSTALSAETGYYRVVEKYIAVTETKINEKVEIVTCCEYAK